MHSLGASPVFRETLIINGAHGILSVTRSYGRFNFSWAFRTGNISSAAGFGYPREWRKLTGHERVAQGDGCRRARERERIREGYAGRNRERERENGRAKKRRKSAEEKEGENRWRCRQVQRWPRHVACQISIYRATKMTKLKRTVRFRRATANHTPPGLRRFSFPDLFAGGTFPAAKRSANRRKSAAARARADPQNARSRVSARGR